VADVVGPGGARVGLGGECAVFCCSLRSPIQTVSVNHFE
jgi:hypothetical protein